MDGISSQCQKLLTSPTTPLKQTGWVMAAGKKTDLILVSRSAAHQPGRGPADGGHSVR